LSLVVSSALAAGTAMPVGNLTGWRQIFTDDFTVDLALGSFPGSYEKKWMSYTGFGDTSGVGWYDQKKVLSVKNGSLDFYMHTDSVTGKPLGAAPIPFLDSNGTWGGMINGRYTIRFRSDSLPGYGTGWLLWSDANDWNEGEIDFPEGSLDGDINAYVHCVGDPSKNCWSKDTGAKFTDWHIATIEWTPASVKLILDDVVLGSPTNAVPIMPMHWVLQACTTGVKPSPSVSGHLQIDWVAVYAYDPTASASTTSTPQVSSTTSATTTAGTATSKSATAGSTTAGTATTGSAATTSATAGTSATTSFAGVSIYATSPVVLAFVVFFGWFY